MGLNASSFLPPFPVPENLLQNLPSTDKAHQIIARTALFVGEHGGQSEIVLRVKQGDNPTFGFLMPHHHLHPYFRYLVDHQELLKADNDSKSQEEKPNGVQASGALSLLGSVYGSGEDEDAAAEIDRGSGQTVSGGAPSAADIPKTDQSVQTLSAGDGAHKDDTVSIRPQLSKMKASIDSKHGRVSSMKINGNILSLISSSTEKTKTTSLFPLSHVETSLVDPPSDIKRSVDRIVEIILKNGKDFEAVLIEQDKKRGKFPFLLPSNQYNPYYLRVLKKAQESRISGKTFPGKDGSSWQEMDKNTAHKTKENELTSLDESDDLDLDYGKKEKFKMVIPKPKKDSLDQPSKESQQQCGVTVDATAAAAILQAATRGIRNPNLNIFSKTSHGSNLEAESSSGSVLKENGEHSHTVCSDMDIAKIAARVVGSEPNSSEERLLKQQKLKAERLRRAKMFAAMIKSGVAPLGTEPPRGSSVEPVGSGNSGLAVENIIEEVKGREGSYPPMESGVSKEVVKSVQNLSNDGNDQKLSKRRHYRSRIRDDGEEEEGSEENGEDGEEDDDKRRSAKRRKSRHSSRHHRDRSKDRHKHRRRHSSKSKESRHRQNPDSSSDEEHKHRKRRHKYEESSDEEREQCKRSRHDSSFKDEKEESKHHRRRHELDDSSEEHHKQRRSRDDSSEEESKHHKRRNRRDGSSEEESKHHKRRNRRDGSSEEESKHHKRRHHESRRKDKHKERSWKNDVLRSEEVELEEGEIRTRSSDQSLSAIGGGASREASVDASRSPKIEKRSLLPPTETTDVPDDLRAKIRAMLLATM
ncbi:hypothetical protein RND81_09G044300 [Saponaria officinalis]